MLVWDQPWCWMVLGWLTNEISSKSLSKTLFRIPFSLWKPQCFMLLVQFVWPCSWLLSVTQRKVKLHWLKPSDYLAQPLATQWLTQRLIGVLKTSYLTHHNNKHRYHAGSFSCLVSEPLKNASYLFPSACWFKADSICPHSPCNKLLYFQCSPDRQTTIYIGCSSATMGDLTLVLLNWKKIMIIKKYTVKSVCIESPK